MYQAGGCLWHRAQYFTIKKFNSWIHPCILVNQEYRSDTHLLGKEGLYKRAGMDNASRGRIFVTIPSDHFGPILAENDPDRNQGFFVGELWARHLNCRQWGVHWPHVTGIAGQAIYGALRWLWRWWGPWRMVLYRGKYVLIIPSYMSFQYFWLVLKVLLQTRGMYVYVDW